MKRSIALLMVIAGLALVFPAWGQPAPETEGAPEIGGGRGIPPGMSRRGLARGGPAARLTLMYDANTVTKVSGTIVTLRTLPPFKKAAAAVGETRVADIKTKQGLLTVFLGPEWFLQQEKVSLKVGDRLEATGSKVNFGEQPAIIARDFRKAGGKLITVRDDQGAPTWVPAAPPAASPGPPPAPPAPPAAAPAE